jgi:hypothetical protein
VYRCADDAELTRLVEANARQFEPTTQFGELFEAGNNRGV